MFNEVRDLEKELGMAEFEYSNNEIDRKKQLENSLRSLKHVKQMREDSNSRMRYFNKPLFNFSWCKRNKNYSEIKEDIDTPLLAGIH